MQMKVELECKHCLLASLHCLSYSMHSLIDAFIVDQPATIDLTSSLLFDVLQHFICIRTGPRSASRTTRWPWSTRMADGRSPITTAVAATFGCWPTRCRSLATRMAAITSSKSETLAMQCCRSEVTCGRGWLPVYISHFINNLQAQSQAKPTAAMACKICHWRSFCAFVCVVIVSTAFAAVSCSCSSHNMKCN